MGITRWAAPLLLWVLAGLAAVKRAASFTITVSDAASTAGIDVLRKAGHEVRSVGPLGPDALMEHADAHAVIVASSTTVTAAFMDAAAELKVIGRAGAGLDNIDVAHAEGKGIGVVRAGDGAVSAASVAEMAFAHVLSLQRRCIPAHASIARGEWRRRDFVGNSVVGKRLGIVGLGRIGKQVAARARAFEMDVCALQREGAPREEGGADPAVPRLPWDDFVRSCDVISIHAPLTEETRHMFDGAAFKAMKPSAVLVNCGRGGIVDEGALLAALEAGDIAGAGLDVLANESQDLDPQVPALAALDNCVITPHLGSSTAEAADEVAVTVAEEVLRYLEAGAA